MAERYAEHITIPATQLTKLQFGRTFRYFIKVKGVDVRIDRTLYKTIKRITEGV